MIAIDIYKFCKKFPLIENYKEAVNDKTQIWHCHHRKETDENISAKELIKLGLYYNRPPEELIFLTPFEHNSLHHKGKRNYWYGKTGKQAPMYGKHHKIKTRNKMSISQQSKSHGPRGKHRVYDNKELNIYHYE